LQWTGAVRPPLGDPDLAPRVAGAAEIDAEDARPEIASASISNARSTVAWRTAARSPWNLWRSIAGSAPRRATAR
jgi:hypothetical protein